MGSSRALTPTATTVNTSQRPPIRRSGTEPPAKPLTGEVDNIDSPTVFSLDPNLVFPDAALPLHLGTEKVLKKILLAFVRSGSYSEQEGCWKPTRTVPDLHSANTHIHSPCKLYGLFLNTVGFFFFLVSRVTFM